MPACCHFGFLIESWTGIGALQGESFQGACGLGDKFWQEWDVLSHQLPRQNRMFEKSEFNWDETMMDLIFPWVCVCVCVIASENMEILHW